MIGIKVILCLFVILFLHMALEQECVVDYILYFEAMVPLVLSVFFLDVLDIAQENGMEEYELKTAFSRYKLISFRYISCLIMAMLGYLLAQVQYFILFYKQIDLLEGAEINGVYYSNITVFKIAFSFMVSMLLLSKLLQIIHILIGNKHIALGAVFIFTIINLVYPNAPINFLSLYYKGEQWMINKIIWLLIVICINVAIYLRSKYSMYLIRAKL